MAETETWSNLVVPLITSRKWKAAKEAFLRVDNELAKDSRQNARVELLIEYGWQVVEKGHELFQTKVLGINSSWLAYPFHNHAQVESILVYEQLQEIITERLSLLNFKDPAKEIAQFTDLSHEQEFNLEVFELLTASQEDPNTRNVLNLLSSAIFFSLVYRSCYDKNILIWRIVFLGIVALLFALLWTR